MEPDSSFRNDLQDDFAEMMNDIDSLIRIEAYQSFEVIIEHMSKEVLMENFVDIVKSHYQEQNEECIQ